MAQRGNRYARRNVPEAERADEAARVAAETDLREIPLELAPLIAPYKRRGRLSLRVERLPFRSRLSKGRNNGDRSWSLAPDELDDIIYSPPNGMVEAHTLAIRVVSLDGGDGATLALLDYPIPACEPVAAAEADGAPAARSMVDDAELQRLREEVVHARISIADCESELAKAHSEADRLRAECKLVETELSQARSAWEGELRERLATAAQQAAKDLENARRGWIAEQSSDVAQSDAAVRDRIAKEKARWQQEADVAQAQAEKSWQAAEAARLAAAERAWQSRLDAAVAEARAAADAPRIEDLELRRLRDELASTRIALVARQTELAQATATQESERTRWRQESAATLAANETRLKGEAAAALAAAETRLKAEGAAALAATETRLRADAEDRVASLESHWRGQLQRTVAEWSEKLARAESSLAKAQSGLDASRSDLAEVASLREQLASAKSALVERETALAAAEAKLDEMRPGVDAYQVTDAELQRLKKDLAAVQATLAEREAELRDERTTSGQARKRWQQELEASLASARTTWKSDEATRLEAAEAHGRQQAAQELDEVMARLRESEASLSQARTEMENLRQGGEDSELRRVRGDLLAAQAVLAERERELTQARRALERTEQPWEMPRQVSIDRSPEDWRSEEEAEERSERTRARRRLARDIGVAGAVAALLMVAFLRVEPTISADLMPQLEPLTARIEPLLRQVGLPLHWQQTAPEPLTPPPAPEVPRSLIGVHDANIRSGPSTKTAVVATLPRDKPVTVVERRGDWALVQFNVNGAVIQQGWIYGSFLKDAAVEPSGSEARPAASHS
jgi:hypothetical protein